VSRKSLSEFQLISSEEILRREIMESQAAVCAFLLIDAPEMGSGLHLQEGSLLMAVGQRFFIHADRDAKGAPQPSHEALY
jgi:hypothetical protein